MTREQMFGVDYDGTFLSGDFVVLYFPEKPRRVPVADCGPGELRCQLRQNETRPGWGYTLCPKHARWWRYAR